MDLIPFSTFRFELGLCLNILRDYFMLNMDIWVILGQADDIITSRAVIVKMMIVR